MLAQAHRSEDRTDPWWSYYTSQGRAADALIIEARQRLSALHGTAASHAP
jgi:hypothetical protein